MNSERISWINVLCSLCIFIFRTFLHNFNNLYGKRQLNCTVLPISYRYVLWNELIKVLEMFLNIWHNILFVYVFVHFVGINRHYTTFNIFHVDDWWTLPISKSDIVQYSLLIINYSSLRAINSNFKLKYGLKRNHLINQNLLMWFIFCIPQNRNS